MSGVELAGVAFSVISLPLLLLQLLENIIKALESLSNAQVEILKLLDEAHHLRDVLFRVRDLIEQQAIDDANVDTLSVVTREGRDLTSVLRDLESLSRKLGQSPLHRSRMNIYVEASRYRHKIRQRRLNLQAILQANGWSPTTATESLAPRQASSGHFAAIADWLDDAESTAVLAELTSRYESGTGSWLLNNSSFQEWELNPGKILWGSGSAGAGKTFLCSKVINHLRQAYDSTTKPTLFAFFRRSSQTEISIVRSLLAQISRQTGRISQALAALYDKHDAVVPALEDLWSALYSSIAGLDQVFIVFDALDEYIHGTEGFLTTFHKLLTLSNTSFFVTSRPTFANKTILGDFTELEIRARDSEIRETARLRLSKSWLMKRPDLFEEILQTIVAKSDGMFLFMQLLLDNVMSKRTAASVKRVLRVDESLYTLFDHWMARFLHTSTDRDRYALEALSWLAYSRTTLSITQLLEAIGIQTGSEALDPDDVPVIEPLDKVLTDLILIESNGQKVSLAHYSLNEYLQGYLPKVRHLLPGSDEPHTFIVKKCLTFLRFKAFSSKIPYEQTELGDRLERYAMLGYAARYWGEHAQYVASDLILNDITALFESTPNTFSAGLIMSSFEKHPGHYEQAYRGMLGLHISAYFGLQDVVTHLIKNKRIDTNVTTIGGWTALHWASSRGKASTVSTLLHFEAIPSATTILDEWNALHLAAKKGHMDIVDSLIEPSPGASKRTAPLLNVNATDSLGRTALYLATWAGHEDVVEYLLSQGADPSVHNKYRATALHCAVKRGHAQIVQHLIKSGAEINAIDIVGLTPLDEANRKQNIDIRNLLEAHGATITRGDYLQSNDKVMDDRNWETYSVNKEETNRIPNGSQCFCEVLEKTVSIDPAQPSLKVFRKKYDLSKDFDGRVQKYFGSERIILDRLRHPNVVTFWDFEEDPEQNALMLYTEYCELGDLNTRYRQIRDTSDKDTKAEDADNENRDEDEFYGFDTDDSPLAMSGESLWVLVAQLASALAYLHYGLSIVHEAGSWTASFETSWSEIIHRDVKPANVVMQQPKSSICDFKLCDLGIASEAGKGAAHNRTLFVGTPAFLPEEVREGKPWHTKGDIWAFGETLKKTNKLNDATSESDTKKLITDCRAEFYGQRPTSLHIMEKAYKVLDDNDILPTLSSPARLQIQATYDLLGGKEGGYILQGFKLIAQLLDDIVPLEDEKARKYRTDTLERLEALWKDGAKEPFLKYPTVFSMHVLILLPLSNKDRMKHLANCIRSNLPLNFHWPRSRWTPLHLAAQTGREEVVQYLLDNGASRDKLDVHSRKPFSYVNGGDDSTMFKLLKTNTAGSMDSMGTMGSIGSLETANQFSDAMETLSLAGSDV